MEIMLTYAALAEERMDLAYGVGIFFLAIAVVALMILAGILFGGNDKDK